VKLVATVVHRVVRTARRVAAEAVRRWVVFGELWRRSLQVRVVISTLALSTAVVFVLGMVLQNEIIDRLVNAKQQAAIAQTGVAQRTVAIALRGADSSTENLPFTLAAALATLTTASTTAGPEAQAAASSAAGAFVPVLVQSAPGGADAAAVPVGPYQNIPQSLRQFVQNGQSGYQMTTVATPAGQQIFLVVGAPISTTLSPSIQLYLMFSMSSEQNTIGVVQEDLILGGLVLVLLLAGITNLVIRQVVRPVRNAAEIAERFAEGHLDERMRVIGEDDVARLAESYNQMAESIQAQIHQLEDFGQLQRRFTSDVSHELRTPLTTVRMAADVLHASREQFPSGLSRSTELLVDELDRFEALLGDLLEISRLDAGVEELASEQVDVRGLARSSVNSVHGLVEATGTSIELDLPAFKQLKENIGQSKWKEELKVFPGDVRHFNFPHKFDFIITNPPFYERDLEADSAAKNLARHSSELTLAELLTVIENNLSPEGTFGILLPYHRAQYFERLAKDRHFYLRERLLVRQTPRHDLFRAVLHFSRHRENFVPDSELSIQDEQGQYTDEFVELMRDYYLKL